MTRTLPNFCVVLCIVILCRSLYCLCICVLNYCHRLATQLQLTLRLLMYIYIYIYIYGAPILDAAPAEIVGSNPTGGMDICLL